MGLTPSFPVASGDALLLWLSSQGTIELLSDV